MLECRSCTLSGSSTRDIWYTAAVFPASPNARVGPTGSNRHHDPFSCTCGSLCGFWDGDALMLHVGSGYVSKLHYYECMRAIVRSHEITGVGGHWKRGFHWKCGFHILVAFKQFRRSGKGSNRWEQTYLRSSLDFNWFVTERVAADRIQRRSLRCLQYRKFHLSLSLLSPLSFVTLSQWPSLDHGEGKELLSSQCVSTLLMQFVDLITRSLSLARPQKPVISCGGRFLSLVLAASNATAIAVSLTVCSEYKQFAKLQRRRKRETLFAIGSS